MERCVSSTRRCLLLLSALREDDLLFITADHGNDPTTASTDHARECVPVLASGPRVRPVTSAAGAPSPTSARRSPNGWGSSFRGRGTSFLPALVAR